MFPRIKSAECADLVKVDFFFDDAYVLCFFFKYFVLIKGVFYCNNMTRLKELCQEIPPSQEIAKCPLN